MRLFSLFRRPTPSDGEGERDQPDGSGFFPDDPNYRRHMSDIAGADVGAPPDFSRWSWRGPRFPATGPGPDTGEAARAQLQADVDAGRATRNGTPLGPPSDDLSFDFGGPMPIVQPLDPNRNRAEPTSPMPPSNPHPGTALPYSFSLPGTSSDEAEENRNAPRGQFPPLNVYSPMSDDGAGIPRPSYSRPPSPPLPTLSEQPESSQAAEQRIEREQQRPCSSSREPRSPGPNQSFKGYQNRWRQAQNVASQRSTSSVRFAGADPNNPPPNRPRPLRKLTSTPIERQGPNLPPQTGGDDYFSHTPGTSSAPRPRNSRAHDSEAGRVPLPPSAPIDRTDTSPLPPRSESEERKDRRRNPVDGPLLDADRSPSPAYRRRLSGRTSSIDDSARVTTEGPSSERSSTPENSPRVVHPENGAYRSALAEERRQRMRRHQAATAMTVRDSKSKSHIRKTIRDIVSLRTYKANKKEKKKQKRRQQRRKKKQKEEGGQKKEEGLKEAVKSDDENSDDEIDRSIWPLKRSESVRPQEISLDEGLKAWKAWKRKFSQQENTLDPTPYPYVSDSATPSKTPPATKFLGKLPSLGKRPSLNQLMVGRDDVWNLINSYTPEMTEREKKESEARKAMWVRDAVEPCTPTELPLSERLLELHMAIYDEHLPNGEKSGHVPPKQSTGYMHHDFRKHLETWRDEINEKLFTFTFTNANYTYWTRNEPEPKAVCASEPLPYPLNRKERIARTAKIRAGLNLQSRRKTKELEKEWTDLMYEESYKGREWIKRARVLKEAHEKARALNRERRKKPATEETLAKEENERQKALKIFRMWDSLWDETNMWHVNPDPKKTDKQLEREAADPAYLLYQSHKAQLEFNSNTMEVGHDTEDTSYETIRLEREERANETLRKERALCREYQGKRKMADLLHGRGDGIPPYFPPEADWGAMDGVSLALRPWLRIWVWPLTRLYYHSRFSPARLTKQGTFEYMKWKWSLLWKEEVEFTKIPVVYWSANDVINNWHQKVRECWEKDGDEEPHMFDADPNYKWVDHPDVALPLDHYLRRVRSNVSVGRVSLKQQNFEHGRWDGDEDHGYLSDTPSSMSRVLDWDMFCERTQRRLNNKRKEYSLNRMAQLAAGFGYPKFRKLIHFHRFGETVVNLHWYMTERRIADGDLTDGVEPRGGYPVGSRPNSPSSSLGLRRQPGYDDCPDDGFGGGPGGGPGGPGGGPGGGFYGGFDGGPSSGPRGPPPGDDGWSDDDFPGEGSAPRSSGTSDFGVRTTEAAPSPRSSLNVTQMQEPVLEPIDEVRTAEAQENKNARDRQPSDELSPTEQDEQVEAAKTPRGLGKSNINTGKSQTDKNNPANVRSREKRGNPPRPSSSLSKRSTYSRGTEPSMGRIEEEEDKRAEHAVTNDEDVDVLPTTQLPEINKDQAIAGGIPEELLHPTRPDGTEYDPDEGITAAQKTLDLDERQRKVRMGSGTADTTQSARPGRTMSGVSGFDSLKLDSERAFEAAINDRDDVHSLDAQGPFPPSNTPSSLAGDIVTGGVPAIETAAALAAANALKHEQEAAVLPETDLPEIKMDQAITSGIPEELLHPKKPDGTMYDAGEGTTAAQEQLDLEERRIQQSRMRSGTADTIQSARSLDTPGPLPPQNTPFSLAENVAEEGVRAIEAAAALAAAQALEREQEAERGREHEKPLISSHPREREFAPSPDSKRVPLSDDEWNTNLRGERLPNVSVTSPGICPPSSSRGMLETAVANSAANSPAGVTPPAMSSGNTPKGLDSHRSSTGSPALTDREEKPRPPTPDPEAEDPEARKRRADTVNNRRENRRKKQRRSGEQAKARLTKDAGWASRRQPIGSPTAHKQLLPSAGPSASGAASSSSAPSIEREEKPRTLTPEPEDEGMDPGPSESSPTLIERKRRGNRETERDARLLDQAKQACLLDSWADGVSSESEYSQDDSQTVSKNNQKEKKKEKEPENKLGDQKAGLKSHSNASGLLDEDATTQRPPSAAVASSSPVTHSTERNEKPRIPSPIPLPADFDPNYGWATYAPEKLMNFWRGKLAKKMKGILKAASNTPLPPSPGLPAADAPSSSAIQARMKQDAGAALGGELTIVSPIATPGPSSLDNAFANAHGQPKAPSSLAGATPSTKAAHFMYIKDDEVARREREERGIDQRISADIERELDREPGMNPGVEN